MQSFSLLVIQPFNHSGNQPCNHAIGRSCQPAALPMDSNGMFLYPHPNVRNFHSGAAGHYVEQRSKGNASSFVYILKYFISFFVESMSMSTIIINACSHIPVIFPCHFSGTWHGVENGFERRAGIGATDDGCVRCLAILHQLLTRC